MADWQFIQLWNASMILAFTFLHVKMVCPHQVIEHLPGLVQFSYPASQHLISQGGDAIDAAGRSLGLFLIPHRSDPSSRLHIAQRPVDDAGGNLSQSELFQLLQQGVPMSRFTVQEQKQC